MSAAQFSAGFAWLLPSERTGVTVAMSLPKESLSESNQLLAWCRRRTAGYGGVAVGDLTTSWKSGAALCALLHSYRPQLL